MTAYSSTHGHDTGGSHRGAPDPGTVLAAFARRRDGRDDEVRVTLARLPNGTPLLNVRRWFRSGAGDWRPTKEGCAFTPPELRALEAAVRRARDVLNAEDGAPGSVADLRGEAP